VWGGLKAISSYSVTPVSLLAAFLALIGAPPLGLGMQRHKCRASGGSGAVFGRGPDLFPAVSCPQGMPHEELASHCARLSARFNGGLIGLHEHDRRGGGLPGELLPSACPCCCRHFPACARRRRWFSARFTASHTVVLLAFMFFCWKSAYLSDKHELPPFPVAAAPVCAHGDFCARCTAT